MSTGRGPFVGVDPLGDAADVDAAAYDDEPDNVAPWYPRHMRVNLRKLKPETLRRYCAVYGLHVRPDCTPYELGVSAGRHFEASLDVDDEESLSEFVAVLKNKDGVADKPAKGASGPGGAPSKKSKRLQARRPGVHDHIVDDGWEMETNGVEEVVPPRAAVTAESDADRREESEQPQEFGEGEGDDDDDDDDAAHCYCRKGDFGEMIACDNGDCPIEWFHLSCVGLSPSTRPGEDDKWYCPECRGAFGSSSKRAGTSGKAASRILTKKTFKKRPVVGPGGGKAKRGRGGY